MTRLSKILGGILRLGANTPLADTVVVVVPGLAGQSRVGNNAELLRLTTLSKHVQLMPQHQNFSFKPPS